MFEDKLKEPVRDQLRAGRRSRCAAAIAAADPILIDTTKNVITGPRRLQLPDRGRWTSPSGRTARSSALFSGQSPVGIRRLPSRSRQAGRDFSNRAARPAPARGWGWRWWRRRWRGMLAFVDVGDAKAAACGPVLAGRDRRRRSARRRARRARTSATARTAKERKRARPPAAKRKTRAEEVPGDLLRGRGGLLPIRHSRSGGNPDTLPSRIQPQRQRVRIPACAGMTDRVRRASRTPTAKARALPLPSSRRKPGSMDSAPYASARKHCRHRHHGSRPPPG